MSKVKNFSLNIGGLLCLLAFVYIVSFILLKDRLLPFSISSAQVSMNHLLKHWHGLVVFILPMYVAFFLIVAGLGGFKLGSALQNLIFRWAKGGNGFYARLRERRRRHLRH